MFPSGGEGSGYLQETLLICEAAEKSKGRIIPFARVHPRMGRDAAHALRAAAERGARGLKLHPFTDGAFLANDPLLVHPLLQIAQEYGIPVLVHSGWSWTSAPGLIVDIAKSFPEISVIMGHSGLFGNHIEAATLGRDVENLYFDLAGLSTPYAVKDLLDRLGPDRLLFGSDYPHSPMGFELEKISQWLDAPWSIIQQIVGLNAAELLGITPSQSDAIA